MILNWTKQKKRKVAKVMRAILVERFPKVFMPKGTAKLPLRIGIHVDIGREAPDLDKWEVKCALDDYTHGPRYWSVMVEGAARVCLTGESCEKVTAAQAAWAARRIATFPFPMPPELRPPAATTIPEELSQTEALR